MPILVVISIVLLASGVAVFAFMRRVLAPTTVSACDPEWITEFSLSKYRPMQRLLDDSDARYLSAQDSCTPQMLKRLRTERRRIFRTYLRSLISDFNRLHMAARMVLLYAEQDRPELASALFRQRVTFALAVAAIECRLTLHALGLTTVNVAGLLNSVDAMRVQVFELAPTAAVA